jgi:hypothetical protein
MPNKTPTLREVQVKIISFLKTGLSKGTLVSDITNRLKRSFQTFVSVVNIYPKRKNIFYDFMDCDICIVISTLSNNIFVSAINDRKGQ